MPKPPVQAATMQSCLQRLQSLQQQFLHIESTEELFELMREGGHLIAKAIQSDAIPIDTLVLLKPSEDLAFTLMNMADRALSNTDREGRQKTYEGGFDAGFPMDGGFARHAMFNLWKYIVTKGSEQQRLIYAEGELSPNIPTRNKGIWEHTPDMVWATSQYKKQGKQFSLFCAELIARIQTAPLDAGQDETDKPKRIRGLSIKELEPIVAAILASEGEQRHLTAKDVYKLATDAGHKTSEPAVKATKAFKYYVKRIGTSKQSNRPKQIISDTLDVMVNESRQIGRTGRKTKPIEPEE